MARRVFRNGPMQVDLKPKEYLALLKAVYLADWLANAHAESPADEDWEIVGICRKVYSLADSFGFGDLAPYHPNRDEHVPSREFVEEMDAAFIAEHIDHAFWRELTVRLTDRLMDERFGAEMDGWTDEHYRACREKLESKVERELRENGLRNLFLLGHFDEDRDEKGPEDYP